MLQAQFLQWQEAATAQLTQLQANMQAQFEQRVAEATRVLDEGEGRRDAREDFFDAKHFRLCKVFEGTSTGLKWEEWKFDVIRAISSRNAECGRAMEGVLKEAGVTNDVATIHIDPGMMKFIHNSSMSSVARTLAKPTSLFEARTTRGLAGVALQQCVCCRDGSIPKRQPGFCRV